MKRGSYSPEFKSEVVLAAIKTNNIRQTAIKYGVDTTTVKKWKDILLDNAQKLYITPVVKPKPITYRRQKTYKATTLAKAFLHVASKTLHNRKKNIKVKKLPTVPVEKIHFKLPPYPENYINSLKPEERPSAVFLYNTRAEMPWMGPKRLAEYMQSNGYAIGKTRIETMSNNMGFKTVYPMLSHNRRRYKDRYEPYLLRGMTIFLPNQVWSTDVSYITVLGYNLYLSAVFDWYSRKVVGWYLADKMTTDAIIKSIQNAMRDHGTPAIINSDQGAQYLSKAYKTFLADHHIRQSMDISKRRYIDNIMIERWFRSLKNELIYLNNYKDKKQIEAAIAEYVDIYNSVRPHTSLKYKTPDRIYYGIFKSSPVLDADYQTKLDAINKREEETKRPKSFQKKLIWPEDTLKALIYDFEAGMNLYRLSHKYKHASATIFKVLEENGIDVSDKKMRERKIEEYKRKRKFNPEDVVRLYNEGYTIKKVGEKLNLSHNTVEKVLNENEIKRRPSSYYKKKKTEEKYDIDNITRQYNSGMSATSISKALHINRETITKILRRNNIGIRPNGSYARSGFTREQISLVVKLYKDGLSAGKIQETTGISDSSIYRILNQMNIERRSVNDYKHPNIFDKYPPSLIQEAIDLYVSGNTLSEVRHKTSIPEGTLRRLLRNNNIPIRKRSNYGHQTVNDIYDRKRINKVIKLYKSGLPAREVSKIVDIPMNTIFLILHRNNVRVRTVGDYSGSSRKKKMTSTKNKPIC